MNELIKVCTKCKQEKPTSEFGNSAAAKDGLRPSCKECHSKVSESYREKHREKLRQQKNIDYQENKDLWKDRYRKSHIKRTYGITLEEYDELLQQQDHCCAICKRNEKEFNRKLAVDHDHVSGEIRGLLCGNCNQRVIGRHRDAKIFKAAWEYLDREFTGWFVPKKKKRRSKRKLKRNLIDE